MNVLVDIYSLEKLAEKEGISYGRLRVIIHELQKDGKPLEWRGYKLFGKPNKLWYAVKSEENLNIFE